MRKLNVTVEECGCYQCGNARTYTYEMEPSVYPNGTYEIKFYEVTWAVQHIKRGAEAITKDGYPVNESSREQIPCREWVDTWRSDTHAN